MKTSKSRVSEYQTILSELILRGGPSTDDVEKLERIIKQVEDDLLKGLITKQEMQQLIRGFGKDFLEDTLQGMALLKPKGYPGDYEMIDRIYTNHLSEHPDHRKWDLYFQNHAAPKAVRNRKEYFKNVIRQAIRPGYKLSLLNVASGPARDLAELYQSLPNPELLTTTCIEMDEDAIEYAKKLTIDFAEKICFIEANILRYHASEKYDLIWSAGLFDYFNDKAFRMMLCRFKNWIKPDGEIIIGNFNENHNPSRGYMEIFGEWYLHHRTEEKLIDLALHVGFAKEQITVGREPENVNLFLHIKT